MAPDYSVRWWRARGLRPPDLDPSEFLSARIRWRYAKGTPNLETSEVKLGDSTRILSRLAGATQRGERERFNLLFTSPPYYAVTNYRLDQWLRLWFLGGPERPRRMGGPWEGKVESAPGYTNLLQRTFALCSQLMADGATVYVRTDARPFTLGTTIAALQGAFPGKPIKTIRRPLTGKSQTRLHGDKTPKPGEVDLVLHC